MNSSFTLAKGYQHPVYIFSILLNSSICIATLLLTTIALFRLFRQSLIHSNPRVFISVSLVYGVIHQITYGVNKYRIVRKIVSNTLELVETSYDCRYITSGFITSIIGFPIIQLDMSIDRLLITIFPLKYPRFQYIIAIFLTISTGTLSVCSFRILTLGDSLQETVPNCAFYPLKSSPRIFSTIRILSWISVGSIVSNLCIIRFNNLKGKRIRYSSLTERYQCQEIQKSTQAVLILATAECFSNWIYSAILLVMEKIKDTIGELAFHVISPYIYTPIHSCLISPLLLIWILRQFRRRRVETIRVLTAIKESPEDHICRLNKMWI